MLKTAPLLLSLPLKVPPKTTKFPSIQPNSDKKRFGDKGPHAWCSVTWFQRLTAGREGQNINTTAAELWIGLFSVAVTQLVEGGSSKARSRFDFQGIHKLIKCLPWMLCKSLWEKVFVKWMNVNLWGTQSWHEKRSSLKRWKPLIWRKLWHSHRHIPNISEWNILIDLTERGESQWTHFTSILSCISEWNRIFS